MSDEQPKRSIKILPDGLIGLHVTRPVDPWKALESLDDEARDMAAELIRDLDIFRAEKKFDKEPIWIPPTTNRTGLATMPLEFEGREMRMMLGADMETLQKRLRVDACVIVNYEED